MRSATASVATVISALEDAEDYEAFEAAIIAEYSVLLAVERGVGVTVMSMPRKTLALTVPQSGSMR